MSDFDEALARLGTALYRQSDANDDRFVSVHSLVLEQIARQTPKSIYSRVFGKRHFDFWGQQEELAKQLAATGLVDQMSRPVEGDHLKRDYFIKLTPLGRRVFEFAEKSHEPPLKSDTELKREDVAALLKDAAKIEGLVSGLVDVRASLNSIILTNKEKSEAYSYLTIMIIAAEMPNPDEGVFWIALNRACQMAGVASLVVALIALKLGQ